MRWGLVDIHMDDSHISDNKCKVWTHTSDKHTDKDVSYKLDNKHKETVHSEGTVHPLLGRWPVRYDAEEGQPQRHRRC